MSADQSRGFVRAYWFGFAWGVIAAMVATALWGVPWA